MEGVGFASIAPAQVVVVQDVFCPDAPRRAGAASPHPSNGKNWSQSLVYEERRHRCWVSFARLAMQGRTETGGEEPHKVVGAARIRPKGREVQGGRSDCAFNDTGRGD